MVKWSVHLRPWFSISHVPFLSSTSPISHPKTTTDFPTDLTTTHHHHQKKVMSTPATTTDLLHAYRKLLRAGLRAVQFSQPSRSVLTDRMREGFRDQHGSFEPERVRRTVWFLNAAAGARGLEHKILKNLCRVHWERMRGVSKTPWRVKMNVEGRREARKGMKEK